MWRTIWKTVKKSRKNSKIPAREWFSPSNCGVSDSDSLERFYFCHFVQWQTVSVFCEPFSSGQSLWSCDQAIEWIYSASFDMKCILYRRLKVAWLPIPPFQTPTRLYCSNQLDSQIDQPLIFWIISFIEKTCTWLGAVFATPPAELVIRNWNVLYSL